MKLKILTPLIAITGLFFLSTSPATAGEDPLEDFVRIVALKETGKDTDMILAAERFLTDHPKAKGIEIVLFYLGKAYHVQKQYAESIQSLTAFLDDHPDSPLATDAAMQRGESYRLTEKYAEMLPDFQKAYRGYKETGHKDAAHAQYHIVQAYNFMKDTKKATVEAELLQKDYPSTSYAKNAARLMKLAPAAKPAGAPAKRGLPVGTKAPEIEMTILQDDSTKKLSGSRGKVVVVDFWASWCGPCQAPMAKMQTYREKHPEWGDKVELIALSIDNTKKAASDHLEKKGWDKTLNAWAGEGGFRANAPTDYQVKGIPALYIINQKGEIAATGHPSSINIPEIIAGLLKQES